MKNANAAPGSPARNRSRPASLALLATAQHDSGSAQVLLAGGRGVVHPSGCTEN